MKIIGPLRQAGQTLTAIAAALEDMGVKTSRGWQVVRHQAMTVLDRAARPVA